MRSLATQLEAIELLDADGREVILGTAWSERTAVLLFIRHFG